MANAKLRTDNARNKDHEENGTESDAKNGEKRRRRVPGLDVENSASLRSVGV
jgi:hypothetical protein